jgi:hypothetical protein
MNNKNLKQLNNGLKCQTNFRKNDNILDQTQTPSFEEDYLSNYNPVLENIFHKEKIFRRQEMALKVIKYKKELLQNEIKKSIRYS